MRYIIIGAGAVGGAIGGRLFEGGREVVLVARGAHYRALAEKGLTLVTPGAAAGRPGRRAGAGTGLDHPGRARRTDRQGELTDRQSRSAARLPLF
jgi:2-dehydropantoate 2-reductase